MDLSSFIGIWPQIEFCTWQFSPLGHYFASASHDRTARLWSVERIQPLRIMAGHLSDVDVSLILYSYSNGILWKWLVRNLCFYRLQIFYCIYLVIWIGDRNFIVFYRISHALWSEWLSFKDVEKLYEAEIRSLTWMGRITLNLLR